MGSLIVLMGPTGAGKSVQGDLLAEALGGVHMSSGELLRQDPRLAAMLKTGKLVPPPEAQRVVDEALGRVPEDHPVILDGTPRTMANVRWLEENLPRHQRALKDVILIELDLETLTKRLSLRNRADDTQEAIRAKWEAFLDQTKPVIDYYREKGMLRAVDGRGTVDEVHKLILASLT